MIGRIAGNASRLPFGLLLSIRSQIADRGVLSLLSVIAVAVAVSLAASVEITSRSVRLETQRTVAAMAGPARRIRARPRCESRPPAPSFPAPG